jgi:hypothetical protein
MAGTRYEKSAACYQFDVELEAYLERESKPFVTTHAQECAFCRVVLADLLELRSLAHQMPLNDPSIVIWANLRARLDQEGISREQIKGWGWLWHWAFLRNPSAVAALACLVILGSLLTVPRGPFEWWGTTGQAFLPEKTTVAAVANPSEDDALAQTIRELETNYKAHGKLMMAPEVKATYDKGLDSLDASIRECRHSLQREPGNTLAQDYLLAAYTQKAEVLSSALEFAGR